MLHIPSRCRVKVGNVVYESTNYKGNNTYIFKSPVIHLNTAIPPLATNIEIVHENLTDPYDISADLASLHVASDVLGEFTIPNEHLFTASISVMTVTFVLLILIVIR